MKKELITKNDLFAIINQTFMDACMAYTIRDGRRFGRYELNLTKDLKRIKVLLRRSWERFPLVLRELQDAIGVNGLTHEINLMDMKIPAVSDYAEIVALINYWGLWDSTDELLALTGKH